MTEAPPTESAAPRGRARTEPPERRRRQLIEATLDAIAENGISGTTLAAVTRRAGLSMGIVSLHFRSKENLLRATLEHLAAEHRALWLEARQDETLAPAEKLRAIMRAHFDPSVCNPRKVSVWFAFFGEARYRDFYHRFVGAQFDIERETAIRELFALMIAEGGYEGLDPLALTKTVESFADGLWLNVMMFPRWLTAAEAEARVLDMLAAFLPRHFPLREPRFGR
jgi:AcrR family transcriptional regulator